MELTAYLNIFRRWSWLIALMALVVGSLSFISSRTQTPLYRASSTIQIGSSGRVSNPGTSLIVTEVQLAQTYAVIAKMYPVLEGTVNQLQLPFSPDALKGIFTTEVIKSTSLLVITVSYSDAVVVSDIANALADQLILNSPTNLTDEQKEQIRQLNEEIGLVADDLASLRTEQQTAPKSPPTSAAKLRPVAIPCAPKSPRCKAIIRACKIPSPACNKRAMPTYSPW
jgi:capsular polysaccharide biosynthesis protein